MSDDKVFTYPGQSADVTWDGRLCIHVGECGRSEGALFEGGRKPWCQPDLTTVEDVVDVVERCPTGALAYIRKDGGAAESAPPQNTVVVANNGPLYLRGDLDIAGVDTDEMPGAAFRAALCRCGLSKNKPFCDNSHNKGGFKDHGAVGEKGKGYEEEGGTVKVSKIKDGPLIVKGNVAIIASSGRVAWKGTRCALCRCGQSKNKPFCDGSHQAAGFEAD